MPNNPADLSDTMYRRLYRLMKRNIEPAVIASTLKLPLSTVQGIISKLHQSSGAKSSLTSKANDRYLDIYFFAKTRYAKLQLVGMAVQGTLKELEVEFEKIESSKWKAVAIEMCDVVELDKAASEMILQFYHEMHKTGRYVAILDPSGNIDPSLQKFGLEGTVPIFGTTNAFEDKAFSKNSGYKTKLL
ncbi:hypothetical protein CHISP_0973 [Chitinispirillum alkaliphilum]|nr:hypothetical protein CHISP_0973 [Chitinispirillum alkaliphilum]